MSHIFIKKPYLLLCLAVVLEKHFNRYRNRNKIRPPDWLKKMYAIDFANQRAEFIYTSVGQNFFILILEIA